VDGPLHSILGNLPKCAEGFVHILVTVEAGSLITLEIHSDLNKNHFYALYYITLPNDHPVILAIKSEKGILDLEKSELRDVYGLRMSDFTTAPHPKTP
jgi:hypothetical protein